MKLRARTYPRSPSKKPEALLLSRSGTPWRTKSHCPHPRHMLCIYYLYLRRLMNKPVCYVLCKYVVYTEFNMILISFITVSITSLKVQEKSCMPSFSVLILIQFHLIRWVFGQEMSWCTNISGGEFFTSFWAEDIYIPPGPYFLQNETSRKVFGGPHGGVANLLHFVKESFLESDQKKHCHFADFYLTIISRV